LQTAFLDAAHTGAINGHPDIEKTRTKFQEIAYWKGWTSDVQAYVQQCHICGTHRPGPRHKQGQMQQALACDVMQKVHVNLVKERISLFTYSNLWLHQIPGLRPNQGQDQCNGGRCPYEAPVPGIRATGNPTPGPRRRILVGHYDMCG